MSEHLDFLAKCLDAAEVIVDQFPPTSGLVHAVSPHDAWVTLVPLVACWPPQARLLLRQVLAEAGAADEPKPEPNDRHLRLVAT